MLVLAGAGALVAAGCAWFLISALSPNTPPALEVANYRGRRVGSIGGVVLIASMLIVEGVVSVLGTVLPAGELSGGGLFEPGALSKYLVAPERIGVLIAALGFFVFGLIDDLMPEASRAKGFKGHISALIRGQISGGILKIAGGIAVGLAAGAIWEIDVGGVLLAAAIIALSANFLNLLDLRPGRSGKVFLAAWLPLMIAALQGPFAAYAATSSFLAGALAVWLRFDLAERGVLGDSGANLIGAILGAGLVLTLGQSGKVVAASVLAVLTLASEIWSFTALIEKFSPLRWLDRAGRAN